MKHKPIYSIIAICVAVCFSYLPISNSKIIRTVFWIMGGRPI